jgi:hypothetical protein
MHGARYRSKTGRLSEQVSLIDVFFRSGEPILSLSFGAFRSPELSDEIAVPVGSAAAVPESAKRGPSPNRDLPMRLGFERSQNARHGTIACSTAV